MSILTNAYLQKGTWLSKKVGLGVICLSIRRASLTFFGIYQGRKMCNFRAIFFVNGSF